MMSYKAGDKFVIEINKVDLDAVGNPIFRVSGTKWSLDESALDKLEVLDGDYVNEHFGELQDESYGVGLSDAWETARKICCDEEDEGILGGKELIEIFGNNDTAWILKKFSVRKAMAKIAEYENEQTIIKVGDVIKHRDNENLKLFVTCIHSDGTFDGVRVYGSDKNGKIGSTYGSRDLCDFERTGEHYDLPMLEKKE